MKTPTPGSASEKKPNTPVVIQPEEEFVDLEVDADLFGPDDLAGIDITDDEGASDER